MAGKSDTFELDLLKLIFNATPIANIADNAATSPLTNLFIALHTADPYAVDETATQSTSECTYSGYARTSVARTTGGWTCATTSGVSTAKPASAINCATSTSGGSSNTITHVSIGVATSGATKILYAGALTPNITTGTGGGVTPQLLTTSQISED